jgi:His/Glu/Gln/Arg/opine family amino acid ABC transporter permease subunit
MDKKNLYKKNKRVSSQNILNIIIIAVLLGLLIFNLNELINFLKSMRNIWIKYNSYFLTGIKVTISMSFIGVFFGTIFGTILYFMRVSKAKIISNIAIAIVELVRGTPLLTQLFIVFFGAGIVVDFKAKGLSLATFAYISGCIAVSLNSGAYVSEIIRSGIQSIPKGQMEAGRSLGMDRAMTMKEIIMPQAIKNILPTLGNEFITLIKETSIVSNIGVMDIMYNVNLVRGNSFKSMEPLIIAAVLYFLMTFTLSKLLGRFERRLKQSD